MASGFAEVEEEYSLSSIDGPSLLASQLVSDAVSEASASPRSHLSDAVQPSSPSGYSTPGYFGNFPLSVDAQSSSGNDLSEDSPFPSISTSSINESNASVQEFMRQTFNDDFLQAAPNN